MLACWSVCLSPPSMKYPAKLLMIKILIKYWCTVDWQSVNAPPFTVWSHFLGRSKSELVEGIWRAAHEEVVQATDTAGYIHIWGQESALEWNDTASSWSIINGFVLITGQGHKLDFSRRNKCRGGAALAMRRGAAVCSCNQYFYCHIIGKGGGTVGDGQTATGYRTGKDKLTFRELICSIETIFQSILVNF